MQRYRSGHKRVAMLKTIDNCFYRVKPPEARSQPSRLARGDDYATVEGVALTRNLFESILVLQFNILCRITQVVERGSEVKNNW